MASVHRIGRIALATLAALAAAGQASAQVHIQPVVVEMGPKQRSAVVTLTMNDKVAAPMRLQAQVLRWKQDASGQPVTEPAPEVIVSPAIAELRPGQRQLFRLALRDPRPGPTETTYRLVLEDVAEAVDAAGQPRTGLTLRMRYDLPVMVGAAAPAVQAFEWRACPPDVAMPTPTPAQASPRDAASIACLRIANTGNRRAKVQSLVLEGGDWRQEHALGEAALVLAGAEREVRVPLPPGKGASLLRVQVQTPQGQVLPAARKS